MIVTILKRWSTGDDKPIIFFLRQHKYLNIKGIIPFSICYLYQNKILLIIGETKLFVAVDSMVSNVDQNIFHIIPMDLFCFFF